MKLYIDNIDIKKLHNLKNLDSYKKNINYFILIYTHEGNFKINYGTNNLQKIKYIDGTNETIQIDKWKCIIDKSYIEYINNYYQIPILHNYEKIIEETYKFTEKSSLTLIILKYENHLIKDLYFVCKDNINNKIIQNELISFLLEIN